jgi:SAM-dependent methyltransferase
VLKGIAKKFGGVFGAQTSKPVLRSSGHCTTCSSEVEFVARDPWLRDFFLCSNCGSIPRERALMAVIDGWFPQWREFAIHESSPSSRGASLRLAGGCERYVASQYYADREPGSIVDGVRCENLEALSFADASIDLHVTQDVMEHVFDPAQVFREIARTLKPGGAHVFTVPIVNKHAASKRRARLEAGGTITHLDTPVYHGNPVSEEGSLVTVDWGYDICRHIFEACGLFTHVVHIDDVSRGIRAELIEVLVTVKPAESSSSLA